jgi:hypothetical protein
MFNFTSWLKRKDGKENTIHKYKVVSSYHEIFHYEYIPTFDKENEDFMIRFYQIENANQLIGKLLFIFDKIGFEVGEVIDVWMNDEIWISATSPNGKVLITRDVYDLVFIMGDNNKHDLDLVEKELNESDDFKN